MPDRELEPVTPQRARSGSSTNIDGSFARQPKLFTPDRKILAGGMCSRAPERQGIPGSALSQ